MVKGKPAPLVFLVAILLLMEAGCQSTCNQDNHLVSYIKGRGVKVLKSPKKTGDYCGTEWATHGTCCDTDDLQELILLEKQSMKKHLREFSHEIWTGKGMMRKFIFKYNSIWKKFLRSRRSGPSKEEEETHHKDVLSQLQEILSYWKDHALDMKNAQKRCLKRLLSLRSSAMCSICSGRFSQFTVQNRIVIPEQACTSVVNECVDAWQTLLKLIQQFRQYREIVNEAKRNSLLGNKKSKDYVSNMKSMENFAKKNNLKMFLKNCRSRSDCDFEAASTLCSTFVSIVQPLYIQKSMKILNSWQAQWAAAFRKFGRMIKMGFKKFGKLVKTDFSKFGKKVKSRFSQLGQKTKKGFKKFGSKLKGMFKRRGRKTRNRLSIRHYPLSGSIPSGSDNLDREKIVVRRNQAKIKSQKESTKRPSSARRFARAVQVANRPKSKYPGRLKVRYPASSRDDIYTENAGADARELLKEEIDPLSPQPNHDNEPAWNQADISLIDSIPNFEIQISLQSEFLCSSSADYQSDQIVAPHNSCLTHGRCANLTLVFP